MFSFYHADLWPHPLFVFAGHRVGGLHRQGPQHVGGVWGRPEGGLQARLAVGDRGDTEEEQTWAAHRRPAGDQRSILLWFHVCFYKIKFLTPEFTSVSLVHRRWGDRRRPGDRVRERPDHHTQRGRRRVLSELKGWLYVSSVQWKCNVLNTVWET